VSKLGQAFALVTAAQPILDRLHKARIKDWRQAGDRISASERAQLEAADAATAAVIAVDDFAPEELGGKPIERQQAKALVDA
jgi:hypothetical protein